MMRRCGQMVSGKILGSREFVEREIREHADVLRSRRARARLAREGEAGEGTLCVGEERGGYGAETAHAKSAKSAKGGEEAMG